MRRCQAAVVRSLPYSLLPQPNSLLPSKNGLHSVAPYNIATTKRQLAAWGQVSKFAYYSKMISKNLFYH